MDAQTRIANAIAALNALELDDFAPVLTAASDAAFLAAAELQSAWQSADPDPRWMSAGKALILCADRIAKATR